MALLVASLAYAKGGTLTGEPETTTRVQAVTTDGNVTVQKEATSNTSTSSTSSTGTTANVDVSSSTSTNTTMTFVPIPVETPAAPATPAYLEIAPDQITCKTKQEPNVTNLWSSTSYVTEVIKTQGLTAAQLTSAVAEALKGYPTREEMTQIITAVLDSRGLATKANLDEAQKAIIARIGDPAQKSDIKDLKDDMHSWGWLWPILLNVLFMILAILLWLCIVIFVIILFVIVLSRIFGWTTTGQSWWLLWWRKPVVVVEPIVEPVPAVLPVLINIDSGDYYGEDAEDATINVTKDGGIVKKWKGYSNKSLVEQFQWAEAGKTQDVKAKVGSIVCFGLARENLGKIPVSTEGVIIKDDPTWEYGILIPGSGRLVVNWEKVKDSNGNAVVIPDEIINEIVSGVAFPLDRLVDWIPANGTVCIEYDINFIPNSTKPTGPAGSKDYHNGSSTKKPAMFPMDAIMAQREKIAAEQAKADKAEADRLAEIAKKEDAKNEAERKRIADQEEAKRKAKAEADAELAKDAKKGKSEKGKDNQGKKPGKKLEVNPALVELEKTIQAKRDLRPEPKPVVLPVITPKPTVFLDEEEIIKNVAIDAAAKELGYIPTGKDRDYILGSIKDFGLENLKRVLSRQKVYNAAIVAIVDACKVLNIKATGAQKLARLITNAKADAEQIAKDIEAKMTVDAILSKYEEPAVTPEYQAAKDEAIALATAAGYTPETSGDEAYWMQIHEAAELLKTPGENAQTVKDEAKRSFEGLVKNAKTLKETV